MSKKVLFGFLTLILAAVLMLTIPHLALAQTAVGEITGVIRDTSGAAVAGVTVALADIGTGFRTLLQTNQAGVYHARWLRGRIESGPKRPDSKRSRCRGWR